MDLEFDIENQIIKRTDNNAVVNKSRNYLECNFSFLSSDWDDVEKFAIFTNTRGNNYLVNLGTLNNSNCIVPSDVLLGDYFRVGVYGGDLITTNSVKIRLLHSSYSKSVSSCKTYKTDVFVQIFQKLDMKFEVASFDGDSKVTFYNIDDDNELVEIGCIDLDLHSLAHSGSYNDLEDVPDDIANVRETISEEIKLSYTQLAGAILSYGN